MNALLQFNHTRFVEAREETKEQMERAEIEQNLENKLESLKQQLSDANQSSDLETANKLICQISELELEIKNLDRPKEDVFLEKFEDGAADPFLEK